MFAVIVAVVACLAALVSCSSSGNGISSPDELPHALTHAIAQDSRTDFDDLFDASVSQASRNMWWSNLGQLSSVEIEAGSEQGRWRVNWTVPGDRAPASQWIAASASCRAGYCKITEFAPIADQPAPGWLVEPITVTTHDGYTLVCGQGATDLSGPASAAIDHLGENPLPPLWSNPVPTVVIECPSSVQAFSAQLGESESQVQALGALTWALDTAADGQTSAVHIMVNPAQSGQWTSSQTAMLLAHESVHVATSELGNPVSGALWVSEGLADWVGLDLDDQEHQTSSQQMMNDCQTREADGTTLHVPSDDDFQARDDADALRDVYAKAWAAVSQLMSESGTDAGAEVIESWWVGASSVDGSSAQTRGNQLLDNWCAEHADS